MVEERFRSSIGLVEMEVIAGCIGELFHACLYETLPNLAPDFMRKEEHDLHLPDFFLARRKNQKKYQEECQNV